jgi:hypothetical protein
MLHLADLITELNGTASKAPLDIPILIDAIRILRSHVYLLFDALLPRPTLCTRKLVGCLSIHALRSVLRFHGREGCEMEEEEQSHGPGA